MVQTKQATFTANVGEEIGIELGAQFISSYRSKNPTDDVSYYVGRNILEQILAQPGCVGIKFYNAYNETGQKVFVYVGVNAEGNDMLNVTSINPSGQLDRSKGIVADRGIGTGTKEISGIDGEDSWWEF